MVAKRTYKKEVVQGYLEDYMKKNITEYVRESTRRVQSVCLAMVLGVSLLNPMTVYGTEAVDVQTEVSTVSMDNVAATESAEAVVISETTEGTETSESTEKTEPDWQRETTESTETTEKTESTEDTESTEVEEPVQSTRTGVVANASSAVNVRAGAGTSYSVVTKVYVGQIVNILEETTLSNQKIWYRISFTKEGESFEGWIHGDYITINQTAAPEEPGTETPDTDTPNMSDEEFVQSLKDAGFPDSYCSGLLALHQKYPKWQFVPVITGLDWSYVIDNESVVGRNLVQNTVNDARKSTASTAYDWATNKWYGFDGDNWVSAAPGYIAYCMDPRNFFDEKYIFQFETLEYESYQNKEGISNILKNSFMSGDYLDTDGVTRNYAETFLNVGIGLDVSPYHLASRCLQEQGTKGTSQLISGNYPSYEGYFNHFNVGAYTTSTASATLNGLAYAKRVGWDSIYKSLQGGSSVVADRYVKKGQNTVYFEKFNVVNKDSLFSHQYMTNVMAAFSEGSTISKAYTNKDAAFVFRIPVYENMPETAVSFHDNGNPNNWLSALDVTGCALTPSFKPETTEYSLIVPDETANITVTAKAVYEKATVAGAGNYTLQYGDNNISVTCIAENGTSRTYTIHVVRIQNAPEEPENPVTPPDTEEPENPETPDTETPDTETPGTEVPTDPNAIKIAEGVYISTSYKVDEMISGVAIGTTGAQFVANISTTNCTVKVLKADGSQQTGAIGTGNKVIIYSMDGNPLAAYDVVIFGDINGDGRISNVDLVRLTKQILKIETLEGAPLAAADVEGDGKISNKDLVAVQKHILNIAQIAQQQ